MELAKTLEAAGLTPGEARCYLALANLGASTAGPVTKAARVSSSKVYEILGRLIEKGLVTTFTSNGARRFQAGSPQRLLEYLDAEQERVAERKAELAKALPRLLGRTKPAARSAALYEGYKAVKGFFIDVKARLPAGAERLALGAAEGHPDTPAAVRFFAWEHRQRIAQGLRMRIIFDPALRRTVGRKHEKLALTRVRYLPLRIPASMAVQGDVVDFLVWKGEPVLFAVTSSEAAGAQRVVFERLWERAKP